MNELVRYEEEGRGEAMPAVVRNDQDALMSMDFDNVLALAERADRMVTALNKIMAAAVRVTTPKDWVLIGGTPYLQESGATKVARLFGIGWRIHEGFPKVEWDTDGYPTYTYRMTFRMGNQSIEAEGMRNARDEFFAGKRSDREGKSLKQKTVDEIDLADVKRAAYTNCLNRGIKAILPGLRNLDAAALEENGVNLGASGGYTFKTGAKGGAKPADSAVVCESCGSAVSQKVASYAQGKFGRVLCMNCQKKASAGEPLDGRAENGAGGDAPPPMDDRDDPGPRRR